MRLRNIRRKKLRANPFPQAWRDMLRAHWPLYARLTPADRSELEGHARVLLHEKYFEACGGVALTEEHRVLIAAQAALLLLHRDHDYFASLRSILVYPTAFIGAGKSQGPGGIVTETRSWRSGESWHTPGVGGPVVLSLQDILRGAADPHDGHNVVLHEFAHQLDAESDVMEGIPRLHTRGEVDRWRDILARERARFIMILQAGAPNIMNPYGAQSPAEFFAVATETFFERGDLLRTQHPDLYGLLEDFYQQNPADSALATCRAPGAICRSGVA